MSNDSNSSDSSRQLVVSTRRNEARDLIENAVGRDKIAVLLRPEVSRNAQVGERPFVSIVDIIEVFTGTSQPSRYWNEQKSALIGNDDELFGEIEKLKLPAWGDGKMRPTDVAPLWAILKIISRLDTPIANSFINAIFRGVTGEQYTEAELRQRVYNIEHGLERNADSIRQIMQTSRQPSTKDTYDEICNECGRMMHRLNDGTFVCWRCDED